MVLLFHGSKNGISGPICPLSNSACDFGRGLYLGDDWTEIARQCISGKRPTVYDAELSLEGLRVLTLDADIAWAMVIACCRRSPLLEDYPSVVRLVEERLSCADVVCGRIADDRMFEVFSGFFLGEITDEALLATLQLMDYRTQYALLTVRACERVHIVREEVLSPEYVEQFRRRATAERASIRQRTDAVLRRYRRVGRYIDEIARSWEDDPESIGLPEARVMSHDG